MNRASELFKISKNGRGKIKCIAKEILGESTIGQEHGEESGGV